MPDHIHMLVHPDLKKELWGGHLWNPSYCAVTVSDRSREQVSAYIKGQKEKEKRKKRERKEKALSTGIGSETFVLRKRGKKMRTVSSYGAEIRKQNIPIRQTMDIYRQAVGYLTETYAQVWEELREIPETKKRFNTAEHMVHTTKKNTARFDFDLRFPKMPSYLRRAAIQHALGSVSSYETRLEQWKETGKLSGKPGLSCENHAMPVFYRDVMYREGAEGKDEAYLKLYDGHDWK